MLQNKGLLGGLGSTLNRNCRALTVQVGASTVAMWIVTPLLNGSVLEAGKVMLMSEGELMDGEKEMEPCARCAVGSKA